MGGIAILVAALVGWLVAHIRRGLPFSDQALIVWVGILVMAFMGFLDDFIKVRRRHNRGHLLEAEELRHDAAQLRHRLVVGGRHGHLDDDLADARRRPGLGTADVRLGRCSPG